MTTNALTLDIASGLFLILLGFAIGFPSGRRSRSKAVEAEKAAVAGLAALKEKHAPVPVHNVPLAPIPAEQVNRREAAVEATQQWTAPRRHWIPVTPPSGPNVRGRHWAPEVQHTQLVQAVQPQEVS